MSKRLSRRGPAGFLLTAALALTLVTGQSRIAAQQPQQQGTADQPFSLVTNVNIVSVDVVVRDSSGNIVRGLTAKDFTVLEDGKPQKIETFSFQEIADDATACQRGRRRAAGLRGQAARRGTEGGKRDSERRARGRCRSPKPNLNGRPAADRCCSTSARCSRKTYSARSKSRMKYVDESMANADLVAVVTIGSRLNVLTDFTSNRRT